MLAFQLELLFEIIGLGSASGLIYKDNSLFIISDNSSFLYQYNIQEKELHKIKLFENSQDNIPKIDKFDFEAITQKGEKLYLFGSGSTSKRNKRISYNLKTKSIEEKDLSPIYEKLKQTASISDADLNLEGAFYITKNGIFFNAEMAHNLKTGSLFRTNKEMTSAFLQSHTKNPKHRSHLHRCHFD